MNGVVVRLEVFAPRQMVLALSPLEQPGRVLQAGATQ
jgi:hypothetical protein